MAKYQGGEAFIEILNANGVETSSSIPVEKCALIR